MLYRLMHLLLLLISFQLSAQELSLSLSQHPNKQAVVVAVHGIRKDTVGTVLLDQNGKGIIAYKTKQPQTGLVNLTIAGKAYLSYDFVLSPTESSTLICDMEYVYAQNTKILNSPENDCLNRWFDDVVRYKKIIALNQELSRLYLPKMSFSKSLAAEKYTVEQQLQKLLDTINQSNLFAGKYMQFKLAQEEKLAKVWESNEQKAIAKNYFATQIDFDALYGSSMWFAIINSCIEAYTKESIFFETFGEDVVVNLKRIKNQQVYEDFIEATISVTEKFGWDKDKEVIVNFIAADNRIIKPTEKLAKIIQTYNLSTGKKAPNIILPKTKIKNKVASRYATEIKTTALNSKYSLLLFYKSGCGYCETTLDQLKKEYKSIVKKGIRVISLSSDTNEKEFKENTATFPWPDNYCDFKGENGVNFKNYGVIGTPTLVLLDSEGRIIKIGAILNEILEILAASLHEKHQ